MHRDRVGKPLSIGDRVAYSSNTHSTRLNIGHVISFSPKRVRVSNQYNRVSDHQPDRVVKIEED